jgi:hypothetical protein
VTGATGPTVFGTYFVGVASEGTDTTTSATFQEKLSLSTGTIPAGTYYVSWYYEMAGTLQNTDMETRVQADNTIDLAMPTHDGDAWGTGGGIYVATLGASGTHTIDIDYRKVSGGGSAQIRRARIAFWRVS